MNKEMTTYLLRAAAILKTEVNPLFFPAVIGVLFFLPDTPNQPAGFLFFLPMVLLFIVYPLIYGRYAEIINNNKRIAYSQIFRAHWLNFFVVSMILGIPLLFFSILGLNMGSGVLEFNKILSIVIDILSIYIFPLVFLLKKRVQSISLGIKCLLGNFSFSIPLIFLTIIPSVLNSFIAYPQGNLALSLPDFILSYVFWIVSLVFDFVIFVAASLILKEKLLP
jgi:hypothetical protein